MLYHQTCHLLCECNVSGALLRGRRAQGPAEGTALGPDFTTTPPWKISSQPPEMRVVIVTVHMP